MGSVASLPPPASAASTRSSATELLSVRHPLPPRPPSEHLKGSHALHPLPRPSVHGRLEPMEPRHGFTRAAATDATPSRPAAASSVSSSSSSLGRHDLHRALFDAAEQLRFRQLGLTSSGAGPTLDRRELETLVTLTRELENVKKVLQRNECSVTRTWSALEGEEGTLSALGVAMHAELLRTHPAYAALFPGMTAAQQAGALVRMVGVALHYSEASAAAAPTAATPPLQRIGALHRGHGVQAAAFDAVRDAFMVALPQFLPAPLTAAAADAWHDFWAATTTALMEGSTSAAGERYGEGYRAARVAALQQDMVLITERQNRCIGREQFVGVMYANAILRDPALAKFDALQDLRASRKVYDSIVHIVTHLSDSTYNMLEYILELGARHTAYNVSTENLHSFTDAFAFACKHFMQEEWTPAADHRFREFFTYVTTGINEGLTSGKDSAVNRRAPSDGRGFCILFTDIESSTDLWRLNPTSMSTAVRNHHGLIRGLIAEYGAYEVKTVGDSFIIACADVLVGVKIALQIQLELMRQVPIAPGFQMVDTAAGTGDPRAWDSATLRVRIGLEHCTDASAVYDTIHRRYDYYGTSVNRCARIEAAAAGGQILLSRESFEALRAIPAFHEESCSGVFRGVEIASPSVVLAPLGLDRFVSVTDVGLVELKGIGVPVRLVSLVPSCLSGRAFPNTIAREASKNAKSIQSG